MRIHNPSCFSTWRTDLQSWPWCTTTRVCWKTTTWLWPSNSSRNVPLFRRGHSQLKNSVTLEVTCLCNYISFVLILPELTLDMGRTQVITPNLVIRSLSQPQFQSQWRSHPSFLTRSFVLKAVTLNLSFSKDATPPFFMVSLQRGPLSASFWSIISVAERSPFPLSSVFPKPL